LHFTRESAESIALNRLTAGAVILAGSGMATGGRVRHHPKHNLWRENSSVIFVGFAARGTLARQIIDSAKSVNLFGQEIPIRARLYTIMGFPPLPTRRNSSPGSGKSTRRARSSFTARSQ
jgi:metallo-beta-lactamase family protein